MSSTATLTRSRLEASADLAVPLAGGPASSQPVRADTGSPSGSDCSSQVSASDDIPHHFRTMKVPDHMHWARLVRDAGYLDMDDLREADADAVAGEIRMPVDVKAKFVEGMGRFVAEGAEADSPEQKGRRGRTPALLLRLCRRLRCCCACMPGRDLPGGDLDASAPRQKDAGGLHWAVIAAIALVVGLVFGAAAGWALRMVVAVVLGPVTIDCLDGDVRITMANRSKKKIRDIIAGDYILTFNHGKAKVGRVVQVKTGHSDRMHSIALKDASGTRTIKATAGHPFYVKGKGWAVSDPEHYSADRPAQRLQVGDRLVLRAGKEAKVVQLSGPLGRAATFNLVLDGPGAFFVEDALSHSGLPPQ